MKLFEVYNGITGNLLDENTTIAANNGRDAVRRFLQKKRIMYKSIESNGGNEVNIKLMPFRIGEDGYTKYAIGRPSWWKVIL